ncbi:GNAT family N-acetyltransferase [Paenibacillus sp. KQZ6P-2]|uniref:GNAT family N-acetyltransferase n=1 Tax=Paenibacillus mangrovi TaxID=2931978 RepID=A0A9X2B8Q5_9BACL|nr:GNAT family N-acetyltransferase [Paenibacillus mangrovi]MCJ8014778.1 GNAT family N-acetyltransferase [Paenibacillus mangrovi]
MALTDYIIHERIPSISEHQYLWEAVGWGSINTERSEGSLKNSLYGVVATVNDEPVGMGRIVGDNFMFFYIQDVAILPSYQGLGLGKQIVNHLLEYIKKRCLNNGIAFVGLFASEGKEAFYEKFGFNNHSPHMTGMFTVIED